MLKNLPHTDNCATFVCPKHESMYHKRLYLYILSVFSALFLFTACDNEPVQKVYYIQLQQVQQKLSDSIKGNYEGRLIAIMVDTAKHLREDEEGVWERKPLCDTILSFPYMVGGYARPFVTIPDFPVSWLSKVVPHAELAEALRAHPNISLTLGYQIRHDFGNDIRSKKGLLILGPSPATFYATFGGTRHLITLDFSNDNMAYEIDADDESTWNINNIRLSLSDVRIDGKRAFDNRVIFEFFIDGTKMDRE